jgi:hypothetical protein
MFEPTRLPCGARIAWGLKDGSEKYGAPGRYAYVTVTEGSNFARTESGNWSSELELIIKRDGLPALRELIDQLIKASE